MKCPVNETVATFTSGLGQIYFLIPLILEINSIPMNNFQWPLGFLEFNWSFKTLELIKLKRNFRYAILVGLKLFYSNFHIFLMLLYIH